MMGDVIFRRYVNDPTTSETELHKRTGEPVEVLHRIEADVEVGPMYRVRFRDGFEADVFNEELDIEGMV